MSDFLTRLIQRTHDSPALVQPLVVSRFAHPPAYSRGHMKPPARTLEENDVPNPEKVVAWHQPLMPGDSKVLEDGRSARPKSEESLLPESFGTHDVVSAALPRQWTKPLESLAEIPPSEPLLVPRPQRAESSHPTPAIESGDHLDQDLTGWEEIPDFHLTTRSSRHIGVSSVQGKIKGPYWQPRHDDPYYGTSMNIAEPPPVQVTIGRVEVRAVLESRPKPQSVPPPTAKVSLENYLRQGKGERR